jgi:two-component system cell cycle sensor histidine kinase/response regulator CckA
MGYSNIEQIPKAARRALEPRRLNIDRDQEKNRLRKSEPMNDDCAEPVPGGVETILLADDEEALRKVSIQYLQARGYKLLEAANGLEALRICKTYAEPIHLLLTDLNMPGLDGPALAEAALAIRPDMRLVYVSGSVDYPRKKLPGTPALLLQKPYGLEPLARTLRAALNCASTKPLEV